MEKFIDIDKKHKAKEISKVDSGTVYEVVEKTKAELASENQETNPANIPTDINALIAQAVAEGIEEFKKTVITKDDIEPEVVEEPEVIDEPEATEKKK